LPHLQSADAVAQGRSGCQRRAGVLGLLALSSVPRDAGASSSRQRLTRSPSSAGFPACVAHKH
jgi:hypothetical protein